MGCCCGLFCCVWVLFVIWETVILALWGWLTERWDAGRK